MSGATTPAIGVRRSGTLTQTHRPIDRPSRDCLHSSHTERAAVGPKLIAPVIENTLHVVSVESKPFAIGGFVGLASLCEPAFLLMSPDSTVIPRHTRITVEPIGEFPNQRSELLSVVVIGELVQRRIARVAVLYDEPARE